MNNQHLVIEFVKRFCAGDIDGLTPLSAAELQLKGPLYQFASRDDYLDALRKDPPDKSGYRLLSVTDSSESVSIFYEYVKTDGIITVAQLFRFKDQKISEMLLVFDSREFA